MQVGVSPRILTAANAFLASVDASQRQRVLYAFDDNVQRAKWSNFPTGFVPRGGIDLKDMRPAQQTAAMALMAVVLSQQGLEKVSQIRAADEAFKADGARNGRGGQGPRGSGGPPGGGQPRDTALPVIRWWALSAGYPAAR